MATLHDYFKIGYGAYQVGKYLYKRKYGDEDDDSNKRQKLTTMPYMRKRKYAYNKRSFKKRAYRRPKRVVSRSIVKKVKRLWRQRDETKHLIISGQGVTGGNDLVSQNIVTSSPMWVLLNGCQRGNTVQSRDGDEAFFTKIRMRLTFYIGSSVVNENHVMVRLVLHKQPRGTAVTAAQYESYAFGASGSQYAGMMLPNINNHSLKEFVTLKEWKFKFSETSLDTIGQEIKDIMWFNKGIKTNYELGNAGTIADIDTNAIYLYVSTTNTVTVNGLDLYGEGHIYFHG